jgi:hypothetical protein
MLESTLTHMPEVDFIPQAGILDFASAIYYTYQREWMPRRCTSLAISYVKPLSELWCTRTQNNPPPSHKYRYTYTPTKTSPAASFRKDRIFFGRKDDIQKHPETF